MVVVSGTYDALLSKLLRDEIDFMIGILKQPDPAFDFVEEPLYRERYCVVARRDHPLTREGAVTVESLRRYQWVLPPKGSPRREAYEHIFSEGAPPTASIETYSLSTIRITLFDTDMLTVLSWTRGAERAPLRPARAAVRRSAVGRPAGRDHHQARTGSPTTSRRPSSGT